MKPWHQTPFSYIGDGRWYTERSFAFGVPGLGRVRIPQGYVFDGPSGPNWLWAFALFLGLRREMVLAASAVHDYLLGCFRDAQEVEPSMIPHPAITHAVFYAAMVESGVTRPRAYGCYVAVRLWGLLVRLGASLRSLFSSRP